MKEGEGIIIENLEANITRLVEFFKTSSAALSVERKEELEKLVNGLETLKATPINLAPVAEELKKIYEKISEETKEDTKPQETIDAIKSLAKAIEEKPVPELDLTELSSILEALSSAIGSIKPEKVVFPEKYPLPEEQLERLVPKKDEGLTLTLQNVFEVINRLQEILSEGIKSTGGGGPDVVALKYFDADRKPIDLIPASQGKQDELLTEAASKYTSLVLPDTSTPDTHQYLGEAIPGSLPSEAKWRIQLIYDNGEGTIEIRWAESTTDFDKVWDDRESYTYI